MSLPELSVRRPVSILMATLAIAVFGFISAGQLPVELLPDLSYPTLTVQTSYPDAAPIAVERLVTRPIEEAVGVIPGVRDMRSTSRAGLSEVTLEFEWTDAIDFAALDVREKLGTVKLPREAELPRVLRFDPALDPVVRLALGGERPLDELWQLAERWLKPRFEATRGVAAAKVRGGIEPEIQIEADLDRLAEMGLPLDDLVTAIRSENVNIPGGSVKDFGAVFLVRTLHEFDDIAKIERTIIRDNEQGRVRVEDVADVRRGHRDRRVATRSQGKEIVELALHREGSANTVDVSESIRSELAAIRAELPDDLELTLLGDQSIYISEAISHVWFAALLGGAIAIAVLYFFLRDIGATIIVALTIPVSVLAAFLLMRRAGVTLNIMSLGGLALGLGMLVDNSIVVIEAIDRHRRSGIDRALAAAKGAREVAGAVTAATLTTLCVFLPIVFVPGIAGQLFYDLAVTVCVSLTASLFVSLTLIPSLVGWGRGHGGSNQPTLFSWDGDRADDLPWTLRIGPLLLAPIGDGRHLVSRVLTLLLLLPRLLLILVFSLVGGCVRLLLRGFELASLPAARAVKALETAYPRMLRRALRGRGGVLLLTLLCFAVSLASIGGLGTQLVPDLSQGTFAFRLRLPEGSPLETSSAIVARIEAILLEDDRFERVFSSIGRLPSAASGRREEGENLAQIDFVLARGAASIGDEAAAVERVREALSLFPRVNAELVLPSVLTLGSPVEVRVFADDLDQLDAASVAVLDTLRGLRYLRDVVSNSEAGNPEILVALNREHTGALGLQGEAISRTLRAQLRGELVGKFRDEEERIDIRVRAAERFRSRADAVERLGVRLPDGSSVPVAALAEITSERGPAAIHRVGGARATEIGARASMADLGTTLERVRVALASLSLPGDAVAELAGQDRELARSFDSLELALALAIFLVYVVMAVQFESLLHPFVILFAVPLGIVGVVATLYMSDLPISVLVLIGTVMLAGVVVNNAIILVDAINRRRCEGENLDAAIVGAGRERFRPILMTTTTTVLALLPMALGLGAGNELRAPLALTVIGGLLGATMLTLIVTPCLYGLIGARSLRMPPEGEPIER
ncbi:MAG: acriflavin resistance protein [Gemmatimonadetes bacterium]|nr:acriflavin resistance protein [Gemmatimonadota bacterium]